MNLTRRPSLACLLIGLHVAGCRQHADSTEAARGILAPVFLVGADGGSVGGPGGSRLQIPAGALTSPVQVRFGLPPVGSNPALPSGVAAVGATYAVIPADLAFASPVIVEIPFDPAQVPCGAHLQLLRTGRVVTDGWRAVPGAELRGNTLRAAAADGGAFVVVVALEPLLPLRTTP